MASIKIVAFSTIVIFEVLNSVALNINGRSAPAGNGVVPDDLFQVLLTKLTDVTDASNVTADVKRQVKAGFNNIFSVTFREEIVSKGTELKELVRKVHDASHDVIDNLGLGSTALTELHADIHHVFSDTFVGSGCYSSYSVNHTGCLTAETSKCKTVRRRVGKEDAGLIVDVHNEIRSRLANGQELDGPGEAEGSSGREKASGMKEMRWDKELASLAQKWADQCQVNPDCEECRRIPRFAVGQNMATFTTEGNEPANWTRAIESWLSERHRLPSTIIKAYEDNLVYRRYSQMIWESTYLIGCGYSSFPSVDNRGTTDVYVCNYGPKGNLPGKPIYSQGLPCTKCPRGHWCSSRNLCTYGTPPPSLFLRDQHASSKGEKLGKPQSTYAPCRSTCVTLKFLPSCNVSTYQKYSDCSDDEICCELTI